MVRIKEYVLTVSRCKGSEAIFVEILNKKIAKPLMVDILKGETTPKLNVKAIAKKPVVVVGTEPNLAKCPHCDKTSYSLPGIKSHITKMHLRPRNKKDGIESEMIEEKTGAMKESGDLISLEANKIVNQLLDDIVYISDEAMKQTVRSTWKKLIKKIPKKRK